MHDLIYIGSVTKFKIMSDGHFDNSKQDKNYLKYILEQFTISKVEQLNNKVLKTFTTFY